MVIRKLWELIKAFGYLAGLSDPSGTETSTIRSCSPKSKVAGILLFIGADNTVDNNFQGFRKTLVRLLKKIKSSEIIQVSNMLTHEGVTISGEAKLFRQPVDKWTEAYSLDNSVDPYFCSLPVQDDFFFLSFLEYVAASMPATHPSPTALAIW